MDLTVLKRNLIIVCPLPRRTENSVVIVDMRRLRLAFKTIHSESLTSISMPRLLLAHAKSPGKVTKK